MEADAPCNANINSSAYTERLGFSRDFWLGEKILINRNDQ
jgi:hypothetical protein